MNLVDTEKKGRLKDLNTLLHRLYVTGMYLVLSTTVQFIIEQIILML